ncbi:MAG: glycosyl hydrolase, partial [Firmicutes bacterium]|nr:glycosyl hydrolase [Bacillota bacterium]
ADNEPLTTADTAVMKEIFGGEWSWDRRAVLVYVDGQVIAGSMAGMPHSIKTIYDNDFPGHFDLHFLNSRTHFDNSIDPEHQKMVQKAAGN